ncbi:hypothetical protein EJB05_31201, partial [Eragrostis curvula]
PLAPCSRSPPNSRNPSAASPRWRASAAEESNSAPQSPTPAARSSPRAAVLGGAALTYSSAGSLGFGGAITGARSYTGSAYPSANASLGAAARPDAHPGGTSGGAGPFAHGEGKRRATTDQEHGEWKKLKGDPPLREKKHIVVDCSAPCFAGKQVRAGDVGQGDEASEGAEGEDEQVGAGDVGQGKEASEGAEGEDEQVGARDVGLGEEASEGTEGENEQVSEGSISLTSGSWSDTDTSSWKGRLDPMAMIRSNSCLAVAAAAAVCYSHEYSANSTEQQAMIKIMEGILETLRANCEVANKFMRGEYTRESIKKVMALVVDCGAAEGTTEHFMATKLFVKEGHRAVFLCMTTKEERLSWLRRWCRMKGLLEA